MVCSYYYGIQNVALEIEGSKDSASQGNKDLMARKTSIMVSLAGILDKHNIPGMADCWGMMEGGGGWKGEWQGLGGLSAARLGGCFEDKPLTTATKGLGLTGSPIVNIQMGNLKGIAAIYQRLAAFFDSKGDEPLSSAELAVCLEWLRQAVEPGVELNDNETETCFGLLPVQKNSSSFPRPPEGHYTFHRQQQGHFDISYPQQGHSSSPAKKTKLPDYTREVETPTGVPTIASLMPVRGEIIKLFQEEVREQEGVKDSPAQVTPPSKTQMVTPLAEKIVTRTAKKILDALDSTKIPTNASPSKRVQEQHVSVPLAIPEIIIPPIAPSFPEESPQAQCPLIIMEDKETLPVYSFGEESGGSIEFDSEVYKRVLAVSNEDLPKYRFN